MTGTTELLHKLLDERGVSYQTNYLHTVWHVGPKLYDALNNLDGTLTVDNLTPEQAIAATLGSGRLTVEQVMAIAGKHQPDYCSDTHACFDWQAIADELNADLGSGMCEPKWTLQGETQTQEFWRCDCGNCGECFGVESRESFPLKMTVGKVDIPNYCPNCGRKVVSE